jgi:hypothetical protein
VVESGGLENRCTERYRGFESYLLRQIPGGKRTIQTIGTYGTWYPTALLWVHSQKDGYPTACRGFDRLKAVMPRQNLSCPGLTGASKGCPPVRVAHHLWWGSEMFDASGSASYHTTMRIDDAGQWRRISAHRKRWDTRLWATQL